MQNRSLSDMKNQFITALYKLETDMDKLALQLEAQFNQLYPPPQVNPLEIRNQNIKIAKQIPAVQQEMEELLAEKQECIDKHEQIHQETFAALTTVSRRIGKSEGEQNLRETMAGFQQVLADYKRQKIVNGCVDAPEMLHQ
eukprot:TRINITY_DN5511_c0_g1_i5.p2 TRINITY_DN5511_c0_g1~~TRINITY_DN5511_c0_g1_i5.p2  ORF type:complete len:141 (+),score=18.34 TRINITY_DN5511_c0_g1_i5:134-556(+)